MWHLNPGAIAAAMIAFSTLSTTVTNHAARSCAAGANDRQQLRVRMGSSGIDPTVIAQARAEVESIWRRYDVDVIWDPQWEPTDPHDRPDLWVTFVEGQQSATTPRAPSAIASIRFDNGMPTHHIRVSTAAAVALLSTKSWAGRERPLSESPLRMQHDVLGRVIGRVLAHEIGHYLLASSRHTDGGLMRAVMDSKHLVEPDARFLSLRHSEVQALRAVRSSRCTAAR